MGRYGLCAKLVAVEGKRDTVASVLRKAFDEGPRLAGCLLYLVFEDADDPSALWITELWTSKDAHDRSLGDEKVRRSIAEALPDIDRAKMLQARLRPLFGVGMPEER